MSLATGTFSIKCLVCGEVHTFQAEESNFELMYGSERQMGPERGYVWEETFSCNGKIDDGDNEEDCNNEIEIEYEVWEYPTGAFNMDEIKLKGAKEIDRFGYDFHGAPEPDEEY